MTRLEPVSREIVCHQTGLLIYCEAEAAEIIYFCVEQISDFLVVFFSRTEMNSKQ